MNVVTKEEQMEESKFVLKHPFSLRIADYDSMQTFPDF